MSVESRTHLAKLDREYAEQVARCDEVYRAAGRAEVAHKSLRARTALRFKDCGMSVAEAELRAEADEHVERAYMDRMVAAAAKDALADTLRALRQRCATGQTFIADERAADLNEARRAA